MPASLTPAIKLTLQCLSASNNALVGSTQKADAILLGSLVSLIENKAVEGVPCTLVEDTVNDLVNNMPTEKDLKKWFQYEVDFSGVIAYLTKYLCRVSKRN